MDDVQFVARYIMKFEHKNCAGEMGAASSGSNDSTTLTFCRWCNREIKDNKKCPKYPFPSFSLVDLMRKLGGRGIPIMVRFDERRDTNQFTIGGPIGRICDTDTPLESLCTFAAEKYKRDLVSTFANLFDASANLFDTVDSLGTPEEIDALLNDIGYDPDELGKRMQDAAEKAFARVERRNSND